jgi:hypothetical protein
MALAMDTNLRSARLRSVINIRVLDSIFLPQFVELLTRLCSVERSKKSQPRT